MREYHRLLVFAGMVAASLCVLTPTFAFAVPPTVDATLVARGNTALAGWYNVPVELRFHDIKWDDPVARNTYGISAVSYATDGGPSVTAESTSCLCLHADGRYVVEVQGTWGGYASPIEFGIDRTPPTSSSDVKSAYVGSAPISLVASDGLSGVATIRYALDGGSKVDVSVWGSAPRATVTVGPGRHTLSWTSVDSANNAERVWHTVGFSVARSAPARRWMSAPRVRIHGKYVRLRSHFARSSDRTVVRFVVERKDGKRWRVVARYSTRVHAGAATYVARRTFQWRGTYRVIAHAASGAISKPAYFRRG